MESTIVGLRALGLGACRALGLGFVASGPVGLKSTGQFGNTLATCEGTKTRFKRSRALSVRLL